MNTSTLFAVLLLTVASSSSAAEFHVAPNGSDTNPGTVGKPFATLEKARDAVRAHKAAHPAEANTVLLHGGTYRLTQPVVFTPEDSGKPGQPLVIAAAPGETPVLTSATPITGWKPADAATPNLAKEARGKVWVADIPKGWRFHFLYADGQPQPVARWHKSENWREWATFAKFEKPGPGGQKLTLHDKSVLAGLPNNGDVEMNLLPECYWNTLAVVRGINPQDGTFVNHSKNPTIANNTFSSHAGRFTLMNALKFLTAPGEWAVDSANGKVYFWPALRSSQSEAGPKSGSPEAMVVTAPASYRLVAVEGTDANPVHDLVFSGLVFEYTDRLPEDQWPDEWIKRQAELPDAMLFMTGADRCTVENSRFSYSGSYAIALTGRAQNNRIVRNEMGYLGCGGVMLQGYGPGNPNVNRNNWVSRNTIHHTGNGGYMHSAAVTLYQSGGNTLSLNWIDHTPYAAIQICGIRWNETRVLSEGPEVCDSYGNRMSMYGINPAGLPKHGAITPTREEFKAYLTSDHNTVENNIVTRYMEKLDDGGALYSWSCGVGNVWRGNLLHGKTGGWVLSALYMDDWSDDSLLENNIAWHASRPTVSRGVNIVFRNNTISGTKPAGFNQRYREIAAEAEKQGGWLKTPDDAILIPAPKPPVPCKPGAWIPAADAAELAGPRFDDQKNIGWCDNGGAFAFGPYTFKPGQLVALEMRVGVDPRYAGGKLTVRLDTPDGPPLGTLILASTGGFDTFQPQAITIWSPHTPHANGNLTGTHTLWFTVEGKAVCNFKAFRLLDAAASILTPTHVAPTDARYRTLCDRAAKSDAAVIFVGDSITQGWETTGRAVWEKSIAPLKALNLGIGGDRIEHMAWRLENGNLPDTLNPKVAVVMAGTNNMGLEGLTPEAIVAGNQALISRIQKRKPGCKILLFSIFPRRDAYNAFIQKVAPLLAKLADGKTVFFLDIGDKFRLADGTPDPKFYSDNVHLNAVGYQMWADGVRPALDKLLGQFGNTSAETLRTLAAARGVISRVTAAPLNNLRMEVIPAQDGRDCHEYEAHDGLLTVRGSSTVALCRGFYDYARANGLGMVSWAEGRHLRIPPRWPDAPSTRLVTPFEIRHAYNVVTPGYTFPYWTWDRWERELDWQAVHGFNMLMAPIATEAIQERMWLSLGLTQAEIDANSCGPAHMPWYRMGNICGIDGYLPKAWHADQVALQHKILTRMRELGIEPVIQGFNGFVPHAYARIQPEVKLFDTCWNGALPAKNRPKMMDLEDPQFAVITKAYLDAWKREFGTANYLLVDSFNEMEVPKTSRPMTDLLAGFGEKTWQAIHAANPDAVWVIQGWTFGYQNWKPENLEALLSKVPDDRMLVLDYANDYFPVWKKYKAFYGKHWACGYVPNMGGKTAYTGILSKYATLSAEVLKSPERGKLNGFTIEGEGLENNEALYELLTDMAWSAEPINLDKWFVTYSVNRYGACPPAVTESWTLLRQGCYGSFNDHPRFTWQRGGRLDRNPNFLVATEKFLSVADELKGNALYRADAVERAALALGFKADDWYGLAHHAYNAGDDKVFGLASARTLELLTQIDRLMEAHPYHRLERWLEFARAHEGSPAEKQAYEANAKCIVTYWANGVQNYSARVWGGLVRDYYREWIRREFDAMKNGTPFDANQFMIAYYGKTVGTTPFTPCADPVADAKTWLKQAMTESLPKVTAPAPVVPGEQVGSWTPANTPADWKPVEWSFPAEFLAKMTGVVFTYTGGKHRLEIKSVEIVADGKTVAESKHFGFAGTPSRLNTYTLAVPAGTTGNNGCIIRAVIRGGGGTDSKGTVNLTTGKP